MSAIGTLAAFAAEADGKNLPAGLLQKMRIHLVDTLAAGIAGSTSEQAGLLRDLHSTDAGVCGILGGGAADARSAALVNGFAAHQFEIDDTGGCDHSGAVVVPALLAVAEAELGRSSMDDLLVAMAVGYEIARRMQFFLGGYPPLNAAGWHSTSVCGPIGAAAAAAKLMGLDASGIADSIGIASSLMAGGWSFKSGGGDNKALHTGLPAAHGVESALLARAGLTGTRSAFDDTWGGVGSLYAPGGANVAALTDGLGIRWVAFDASIKPFPTCASSHRMIQLAERSLAPARIRTEAIEQLRVRVGPLVADMCGESSPAALASLRQRQLSIPFGIAFVLTEGAMSFEGLMAGPSAEMERLLERTVIEIDEQISGGHGEGTLTVVVDGAATTFSTDDVADPRHNIDSLDAVMLKAAEVLRAVGCERWLPFLAAVAEHPGGEAVDAVFAARPASP